MQCRAIDGFYLKANGEVPCWCSPGEVHPILRLDAAGLVGKDVVRDVLNGPTFTRMRRALKQDRLPFHYCRGCWFLEQDGPGGWDLVDPDTFAVRGLRQLQVESSYLCNVDCPLCVKLATRKQSKEPPYQLDLALYRKVVDDLAAHQIRVEEVWFSGRGEPLMNPDFPELVRYGRARLGARMTCHTNGNFAFRDELLACGLDELQIAFDGVDQASYERYRRGGRLDRVTRFAGEFAAARRQSGASAPALVWKMVLFEWNSSDGEVEEAVDRAHQLGLDRVLLVNTDTPGGMSFRDGGARARAMLPLIERLQGKHPGLAVEFLGGFRSGFGHLPQLEAGLRVEATEPARTVLLGRVVNHLLEPRRIQARLTLQDDRGGPEHVLADVPVELADTSEKLDSFAIPTSGLLPGEYRVWLRATDAATGELLAEAAADFDLPPRG